MTIAIDQVRSWCSLDTAPRLTGMTETFVRGLQIVVAAKGRERQFWVAVTQRIKVVAAVQKRLEDGPLRQAHKLKLRLNGACQWDPISQAAKFVVDLATPDAGRPRLAASIVTYATAASSRRVTPMIVRHWGYCVLLVSTVTPHTLHQPRGHSEVPKLRRTV
jgi:hypothetical protein